MTKHAAIYPTEEELQAVQKIVSITERALKLVSDNMTDNEKNKSKEGDDKKEGGKDRYVLLPLLPAIIVLGEGLRQNGAFALLHANFLNFCAQK